MRLEDFDSGEQYRARVLANTAITPPQAAEEVRELVLEIDRPDFEYGIGQSVGVIIEGPFKQQAARPDLELAHAHHFRLYTVADTPHLKDNGKPEIKLCVKRCSYIDAYSGEEYPGIASNHLCDLQLDDNVLINGPFGLPFELPSDKSSDLLMIGMGTGIAPFRAFVKHLYHDVGDWVGKVRVFCGARSGLEMLYMNDEKDDFAQYYDEETFAAFKAVSPRPGWGDPVAIGEALEQRAEEVLAILQADKGCVYVAGRQDILDTLEKVFSILLGSETEWARVKAEMRQSGRWQELIY
jgi:ferredoxin--NADP+ reductase